MTQNLNTNLHPMHSIEFVKLYLDQFGCYPGKRCTGRSTAIMLRTLAEVIENPYVPVAVQDHHDMNLTHEHLARQIVDLADRLRLPGVLKIQDQVCAKVSKKLPHITWSRA